MDTVDPARSPSRAELEAGHLTARAMPAIPPIEEEACSRPLLLSLAESHHMPLNTISTSPVSLLEIQGIQELDNELMDIESIIRLGSQHVEEVNEEYEGSGESEGDISGDSIEPHVGMEFANLDIAYDFYNHYALQNGFGIRKSKSWKSRSDKDKILAKFFVCNKKGIKAFMDGDPVSCIRATRVGCKALMKVVPTDNNTWKVSKFVKEHNDHELTTPSKTMKHRSHQTTHRKAKVRKLINDFHNQGLRNTNVASAINTYIGGGQSEVKAQHVHEVLRVERRKNLGKNCGLVINHFKERQISDPDFYFNFDMDQETSTFRSIFWADGRSRASYAKFSDVVVFDVTYRTNNLHLPFAPFTGINHHFQSSLFGCALLADETETTFVWLFKEWLKCMRSVHPGAIITDQDAAMSNAIAKVFPDTTHRFCEWHLDRNIKDHLHHLEARHGPEFRKLFEQLRASDSIPQAESRWDELITKYPMSEKSWLPKMWGRRRSWMDCYLADVFLASTRTSQRSESINFFFDKYVTATTPVTEFVFQYDRAVTARRRAEEDEDFRTMNSKPNLDGQWKLEETAASRYTKKIFENYFRQELKDSRWCWNKKIEDDGTIVKYIVGRPKSQTEWTVTFENSHGGVVTCDCRLFEQMGILCKHALNVLWQEYVLDLPERYILKRWTIESRHKNIQANPMFSSGGTASIDVSPQMYFELRHLCNFVVEESSTSLALYKWAYSYISDLVVEINQEKDGSQIQEPDVLTSQVGSSTSIPFFSNADKYPNIIIHDPSEPARTKGGRGRPKGTIRLQSGLEISQNEEEKQSRRCKGCGLPHHNIRTCPAERAKAEAAIKVAREAADKD